MKTSHLLSSLLVCAPILCLVASEVNLTVTNVLTRQRWPWSRKIDITYAVESPSGAGADIQFQLRSGNEVLNIPERAVSGDRFGVVGAGCLTVDPLQTEYTNREAMTISAKLKATPAPVYIVYDLTKSAGDEGQVEYVYAGDSRLETYGRFKDVWFSLTNDVSYKTTKLVLRRCPEGSIHVGSDLASTTTPLTNPEPIPNKGFVTLSRPTYMAVFELTEAQYAAAIGMSVSSYVKGANYPKGNISYVQYRGESLDPQGANPLTWPKTGDAVGYEKQTSGAWQKSFLMVLREKTGNNGFDIPTEGQWEYACRAGSETYFSSGLRREDVSSDAAVANPIAWTKSNSGMTVHPVGLLLPNNWGLYDMQGNLFEFCRDVYVADQWPDGVDPAGASASSATVNRVRRGGNYGFDLQGATAGYRMDLPYNRQAEGVGLRLMAAFSYLEDVK